VLMCRCIRLLYSTRGTNISDAVKMRKLIQVGVRNTQEAP
jgi:hypothetical protein